MKQTLGAFVIIVGLAGLGCGGGGDLELEDFAAEIGAVTCEKIFSCCSDPEILDEFAGISPPIDSVQDCTDFYTGLATALLVPSIRDGVEDGRLVYHADRAGDCLDAMAELSCAEFAATRGRETFGGCDSPIEPLVETGGSCFSDSDCIAGFCQQQGQDEGTCVELPGEGDACDFECADGFYCGSDPETFERVCQAELVDGSECDSDDECESGNCEGGDPQTGTPGSCSSSMTCDGV